MIIHYSDWTDFFLQSDAQLLGDIFYYRTTVIINSISLLRTLATKEGASDKPIHRLMKKIDKLSRQFLELRDIIAIIQCQKVLNPFPSLMLILETNRENAAISHP